MADDTPYFEQDEKTGKITQQYSDEQFIEAVRERSPASTSEVGEEVGCSPDNAYRRLKRLEQEGTVESKTAGNSLIWFPGGEQDQV
jgi:predicted ArsR family transcriptional regulator